MCTVAQWRCNILPIKTAPRDCMLKIVKKTKVIVSLATAALVMGTNSPSQAGPLTELVEFVIKIFAKSADEAAIVYSVTATGRKALNHILAGDKEDLLNCDQNQIKTIKNPTAHIYKSPSISSSIAKKLKSKEKVCILEWSGELLNKDLEAYKVKGGEKFYLVRGGFILKENFD